MRGSDLLALTTDPNGSEDRIHLKVLSQWLADRLVVGHSTRAAALLRVVGALLTGSKLSLSHLGRLNGPRTSSIRSKPSIWEIGIFIESATASIGRELLKRLDDFPRPVIDLALLTLRHHISAALPP